MNAIKTPYEKRMGESREVVIEILTEIMELNRIVSENVSLDYLGNVDGVSFRIVENHSNEVLMRKTLYLNYDNWLEALSDKESQRFELMDRTYRELNRIKEIIKRFKETGMIDRSELDSKSIYY